MKWLMVLGAFAAGLAALLGLVALVGALLPKGHVASRRVVIHGPPAEVFAAVRDFGHAAEWRTDVKKVTILGETNGKLRFREEGSHGKITFELVEESRDARLVSRIVDENLPFGGSWTYELRPVSGGTEIAITERGEVKNVIFRALSKYVFTHHKTIEQYLRALGKRFGEDVTPEPTGVTI